MIAITFRGKIEIMNSKVAQKIENFFGHYRLRHFNKGYILIYADNDPPGVFHLISGQVRQYDISSSGSEVVVNVFKPPAFFPMSWAINKTSNQYFFQASTDVSLRMAPVNDAVEFLKTNPDVMFDLLSRVYSGTDGLLRRMAHLMGSNASTRLLYELLIVCRRFGQPQPDGTYLVLISEEELARRAGLTRETISRELGKIKKMDLASVSRKGFSIKNLEKIEEQLGSNL